MFPVIDWHLISLESLISITLFVLVVVEIALPKNTSQDVIGGFSFLSLAGLIVFWTTQGGL